MSKEFDVLGNEIDKEVGYARGEILFDSYTEKAKQQHAVRKIKERISILGENNIHIFTGNIRENQLKHSDLSLISEEWIGPSLFSDSLNKAVLKHFGVENEEYEVATFNRTSAALVSSVLAFSSKDSIVLSFAAGQKAHPSVSRGVKLAASKLIELRNVKDLNSIECPENTLLVITGVTSELLFLKEEEIIEAIRIAKEKNYIVVVDDAYGARIRTILLNQDHALKLGADIVITNNDKAALHGPRAGIMAGKSDYVIKVSAKGSEYGLEARAPISLAVLRSLESFNAEELVEEKNIGELLYKSLANVLGNHRVRHTLLGPELSPDNITEYIIEKTGKSNINIVPAEITAAIGFVMLEKYGIVTTNTCGMPGARVSIRLKTNRETVNNFGGIDKITKAVIDSIDTVASQVSDVKNIKGIILGED